MTTIKSAAEMPLRLRDALVEAARRAVPREICGFVMPDWYLVFLPNISDRNDRFEIADGVLLEFYAEFPRPLGFFHSHPNCQEHPSQLDFDYAPIDLRYWIVTPIGNVVEWDMNHDRPIRVP